MVLLFGEHSVSDVPWLLYPMVRVFRAACDDLMPGVYVGDMKPGFVSGLGRNPKCGILLDVY
jgi:hypothetical protein